MLESKFVKIVKTHLKSKRWWYCIKFHANGFTEPGVPDLICSYKGYFVGLELKTTSKPSPIQLYEQQLLRSKNNISEIITPENWQIIIKEIETKIDKEIEKRNDD